MLAAGTDEFRPDGRPTSTPPGEKEKRRIPRISLPLPVRVEVKIDVNTGWNEITRLSDVSAFGAGFPLKKPIKRGRLVLLTIPMPRQLRAFDYSEPQYRVWAVVRRCISIGKTVAAPEYAIGVAFTGKTPPLGYVERPSMLYDIAHRSEDGAGFWHLMPANLWADENDIEPEFRKQTRFEIPETLILEKLDDLGNVIATEDTVTENISLGGASVFTTFKADAGTFMRVTSPRFNITILSVVRGKRVGEDGITRLHLEFIDQLFPLEGIVSAE
ncbi:MAG: PilZ domain-containing protein [Pyrinomonadaceae bacterium]